MGRPGERGGEEERAEGVRGGKCGGGKCGGGNPSSGLCTLPSPPLSLCLCINQT